MRFLYLALLGLTLAVGGIAFGSAGPAAARQDDARLDKLFETLQATTSKDEARVVQDHIWDLWFQSGRADIDSLVARGREAMSRRNFKEALDLFNDVIAEDPGLAEGWNLRATLYYIVGEFEASIADIESTLALEPRHFGALSGLGLVNIRLGRFDAAIEAFEAALKVNPHTLGATENIRMLRSRGTDI